jgi:hypothetical protein
MVTMATQQQNEVRGPARPGREREIGGRKREREVGMVTMATQQQNEV